MQIPSSLIPLYFSFFLRYRMIVVVVIGSSGRGSVDGIVVVGVSSLSPLHVYPLPSFLHSSHPTILFHTTHPILFLLPFLLFLTPIQDGCCCCYQWCQNLSLTHILALSYWSVVVLVLELLLITEELKDEMILATVYRLHRHNFTGRLHGNATRLVATIMYVVNLYIKY